MDGITDFAPIQPGIDPDDQIWKSYIKEATAQDDSSILNWNQNLDVLLVFVRVISPSTLIVIDLVSGWTFFSYLDWIHH